MAISETGVGTHWQFWRYFDQSTTVSLKRCKIGPRLLLITNRKSHTRIRVVPTSTTLDDPKLTLNGYHALCYITHMSLGAHHINFNDDRPILPATKMCFASTSNELAFWLSVSDKTVLKFAELRIYCQRQKCIPIQE